MKKHLCILTVLIFSVLLAGSAAATVCVPTGCDGVCPANCTVADDPDCSDKGCCADGWVQQGIVGRTDEECDDSGSIKISTCEELQGIGTTTGPLNGDYVLTGNIPCGVTNTWNEIPASSGVFLGFKPIGTGSGTFNGTFDGKGFEINNLYSNFNVGTPMGLFAIIDNAEIKNVGLLNLNLFGGSSSGGLVGYSENSSVSNSYSTGSVHGVLRVGGLVGYSANSSVSNSYSTVNVRGDSGYVGGLIGESKDNSVSNSYFKGSIYNTALAHIGGLVGYSLRDSISNSYAVTNQIVPLTGHAGLFGASRDRSYSGLFWDEGTSLINIGCYYDWGIPCTGIAGKTTPQMQTESTFTAAGWDFVGESVNGTENIWSIDSVTNDSYPFLRICGDGICNPASEACYTCPSDCGICTGWNNTSACAGNCQAGCVCPAAPVCVTDGFCDGVCPAGCTAIEDPDCNPLGCCGDDIVQAPNGSGFDEVCDGSNDVACPGLCQVGCVCGLVPECNLAEICCSAAGFFEPVTTVCDSSVAGERCSGMACGDNVEEQSFTQYCSGDAETCTGNTVDNGWIIKADCGANEKCDDTGLPPVCIVDPVCSAVPATAEFQIVSFVLDTNPVTVTLPVTVNALVEVVNLGTVLEDSVVRISVKDLSSVSMSVNESLQLPVGSSPVPFEIPFTVLSTWDFGNYEVIATASQVAVAVPDSMDVEYLNVLGPPRTSAVPELGFLVIPLLLAIVLFVLKKK